MPTKQRTVVLASSPDADDSVTPEESVRRYLNFLADPDSVVDQEEIARLEKGANESCDPLERLRHAAALERARVPDGAGLLADFVRHAKAWADSQDVPVSAFRSMGVHESVLRKAGLAKATRRTGSRPARRVTVDEMKSWALAQDAPFVVKDVTAALGGSLVTASKAMRELHEEGALTNLGPAVGHRGPGRAPVRYEVTRKRRGRN